MTETGDTNNTTTTSSSDRDHDGVAPPTSQSSNHDDSFEGRDERNKNNNLAGNIVLETHSQPCISVADPPSNNQQQSHDDIVPATEASVLSVEHRHAESTCESSIGTFRAIDPGTATNVSSKSRDEHDRSAQPGAVSVPGIGQETQRDSGHQSLEDDSVDQQHDSVTSNSEDHRRGSQFQDASSSLVSENQQVEPNVESQRQEETDPTSFLVEAELVAPPVEAVSVVIDEEQRPQQPHTTTGEQDVSNSQSVRSRRKMEKSSRREQERTRRSKRWIYLLVTFVIVMVVIAVIWVIVDINTNRGDTNDSNRIGQTPVFDSSDDFEYECFTSTRELLLAQIDDFIESRYTQTKDLYIICPGSNIQIGVFANPAVNDYNITGGDQPLMALMNDTTIQCGLDGRRENSCILEGGFVQVIMQTRIPGIEPDDALLVKWLHENDPLTVHNVTFRGLTFTGVMKGSGWLMGVSFLLSQPGNVTVEDCLWTNMTTNGNILAVGQNEYQASAAGGFEEIPTHSAMLTIRNCQFETIVYDQPMIAAKSQVAVVENCTFSDITVSALPSLICGGQLLEGCASIMTCLGDAACFLSNSCFHRVKVLGHALIIFEKYENALAVAPQFPDAGTLLISIGNETNAETTFTSAVSNYNNFLDDESRTDLSCELIILGLDWDSQSNNQLLASMECYNDLAFQAGLCSL
ncbi:hypothetical protein IV203_012958 [Nitzschia inconspicua]|uniref:Uncharacterized protein n=1 Tax=Nitzschia inconspicua TaxID=303405 RepID=A0A9K3M508_9STRA|nr:hypothetical protein IV203_012958 [Nitzschia inconspicua]